MNKTKIEWCMMTWNPVTGCLHGCEYCYARKIAQRFGGAAGINGECHEAGEGDGLYPNKFAPTLYRYRFIEPLKIKKSQNIFVCSMADLFGEWVPDSWIREVFNACESAPQHRYLFLTKNPYRYIKLFERGILPAGDNFWFGSTAVSQETYFWWSGLHNFFVSIEPILGPFDEAITSVRNLKWVIVGAETGSRKGKIIPQRSWIENIVENCRATETPVFLKNSLSKIWGAPLIQEYPWK